VELLSSRHGRGSHDGVGTMETFHDLGQRVLVERELGLPPVEAEILAHNFHRPHLVKVAYRLPQPAEWIFRSRIAGPADSLDVAS
jgi:hypothetical protein